jgi:hypothetical protein
VFDCFGRRLPVEAPEDPKRTITSQLQRDELDNPFQLLPNALDLSNPFADLSDAPPLFGATAVSFGSLTIPELPATPSPPLAPPSPPPLPSLPATTVRSAPASAKSISISTIKALLKKQPVAGRRRKAKHLLPTAATLPESPLPPVSPPPVTSPEGSPPLPEFGVSSPPVFSEAPVGAAASSLSSSTTTIDIVRPEDELLLPLIPTTEVQ